MKQITAIERTEFGRYIHAVLLIALFVVEAAVFYAHVAHSVAPFYPPIFDQLGYYLSTYDLIAAFHAHGATAFVAELFQPASATGSTFVLQGALLSFIGGENRTALLSINLIYLLALQLVLFFVIRSRSSAAFAWTGMALLLSMATLFKSAGGIYDYRIDFSAFCLYGIWACLIVWSHAFRDTGRTVAVAIVGILLIYSRFFTVIYIGGVLGALLATNILAVWLGKTADQKATATARTRNIVLAGLIIAAVCLPRLYLSRDAIYGYYMIGHVLGEEKFIRAHELGLYSLGDHLRFYPTSIVRHIGLLTLLIAGALAGWSLWREPATMREMRARLRRYGHEFLALGLAVLIPVVILTANVSKSPVVGGVVTVPIVLAMILFGAAIWPHGAAIGLRRSVRLNVATIAMAVALVAFVNKGLSSNDLAPRADLERITELAGAIARHAADHGLDRISMSTDRVDDYQNIGTPKLYSIERLHRNLDVAGLLGHGAHGIFATSREDALRLLAESDVIVLTDAVTDRGHPYPMNSKIKEYWDDLWRWTNQNRSLLYATEIFGIPYRVFVRFPASEPATKPERR